MSHAQKVLIPRLRIAGTPAHRAAGACLTVYCEVHPPASALPRCAPPSRRKPIILSGGPASVYDEGAPTSTRHLGLDLPILGICYGQQLLAKKLAAKWCRRRTASTAAPPSENRGQSPPLGVVHAWRPLRRMDESRDRIEACPTTSWPIAATDSTRSPPWRTDAANLGIQFHAEVSHTRAAAKFGRFLFEVAKLKPHLDDGFVLDEQVNAIRSKVGRTRGPLRPVRRRRLVGGGGRLLARAPGDRVACIFVDNGLVRRNGPSGARAFRARLRGAAGGGQRSGALLGRSAGVTDPEQKRKIIGRESSRCSTPSRQYRQRQVPGAGHALPDVIESVSFRGPSAVIKTHHNVGGLPANMKLKLIEPLRELFKDEVRLLGAELGLPQHLVQRQAFPGPGLRCASGRSHRERLTILRHADAIVEEEIIAAGYYERVWQSFAVLLPVLRSVGRHGRRPHLRANHRRCARWTRGGMTADWSRLPYELLGRISNRRHQRGARVNRGSTTSRRSRRRPSSGNRGRRLPRSVLFVARGGGGRDRTRRWRSTVEDGRDVLGEKGLGAAHGRHHPGQGGDGPTAHQTRNR